MKLLGLAVLFFGNTVFAAQAGYELDMKLSLDGKHVSSPRLIVKEGEAGLIVQKTDTEESFIEVVATEGAIQNNTGILMKFVVGVIAPDGTRTVLSKPRILAMENQQITVGNENGQESISLSVIAKRTSLQE